MWQPDKYLFTNTHILEFFRLCHLDGHKELTVTPLIKHFRKRNSKIEQRLERLKIKDNLKCYMRYKSGRKVRHFRLNTNKYDLNISFFDYRRTKFMWKGKMENIKKREEKYNKYFVEDVFYRGI